MNRISITLFALIGYLVILACKSPILGPDYPITNFSEYDYVVIATVNEAEHESDGYQGLNSFKITIKKCLKGSLDIGEQVNGRAKKEQAKAVCPIHLDENSDYLLLISSSIDGYKLSRFSFPVKSAYQYFDDYIDQIESALNEKEKEKNYPQQRL